MAEQTGRPFFSPGDPIPAFSVRSSNSPVFRFNTVAGRYNVLCFFGTASERNLQVLQHFTSHNDFFNDEKASFFGVSIDPKDETEGRVQQRVPGFRYFWDFDRKVSTLYGAVNRATSTDKAVAYQPFTLVLDPLLRVIAVIPLSDPARHNAIFDDVIKRLPEIDGYAGVKLNAPVLVLPRVFEPEFCRRLISLYNQHGGQESGFMREVDGKTVGVLDHQFKRRKDYYLDKDPANDEVCAGTRVRIGRRLVPEVFKAFQFKVTRMERYVVACYDGTSGGFFRSHRDNTTKGTAHRQFACTINLNAEEFEGGELRFPEFGSQTYRAPTGGAVVFSCSLLHEAMPVTKGTRYAFLPFLYDDAAAKLRAENQQFLTGETYDANKMREEISAGALPSAGAE